MLTDVYELTFLIGAIGFTALAALSFVGSHDNGGHHGPGGHHSHGGGHHAPTGEHVGRVRVSTPKSHEGRGGPRGREGRTFLSLSPLDIFAYTLGFGSAGILLRPFHLRLEILLALFGAILLNHAVIKPLMTYLLHFASKPSEGLEGIVAQEAEAVSRFDEEGKGLVKVVLDGETVQVLARLQSGETGAVVKGDILVVTAVDAIRNQLTVTRELA
ncbi:hypothetical protein EON81_05030 [bacterium]|nr:MAG: hypothetical protein EON81_05030 [bacterium]